MRWARGFVEQRVVPRGPSGGDGLDGGRVGWGKCGLRRQGAGGRGGKVGAEPNAVRGATGNHGDDAERVRIRVGGRGQRVLLDIGPAQAAEIDCVEQAQELEAGFRGLKEVSGGLRRPDRLALDQRLKGMLASRGWGAAEPEAKRSKAAVVHWICAVSGEPASRPGELAELPLARQKPERIMHPRGQPSGKAAGTSAGLDAVPDRRGWHGAAP